MFSLVPQPVKGWTTFMQFVAGALLQKLRVNGNDTYLLAFGLIARNEGAKAVPYAEKSRETNGPTAHRLRGFDAGI